MEIAGKTDPGCVRERNEDSIAWDPEIGLMVVADGMGGHNSGEVASRLAADTIQRLARELVAGGKEILPPEEAPGLSVRGRQLLYCIRNANAVIYEKSQALAKDHGMGTTVVAALADEKSIVVGHVGDSRLYRLRGEELALLTEDHSLVMDQVRHGLLTPEQAERSSLQNILTRALGTEERVQVDVQEFPLLPGDMFLLCSDGLTKMVSENETARILAESPGPAEAADRLVGQARAAGGVDNIAVVVGRLAAPERGLKGLLSRFLGG